MKLNAFGRVVGVGAVVASALAAGCAHDAVPPQSPVAQTTSSTTITSGVAPATKGVVVSDELRKACNIDLNNEQTAPKFDFDNSAIRADDRAILDQIARCVTSGPLKGRSLHLVGRADPRGEDEYNMVLGSSRASSVASYLAALGVSRSQMAETSRGKLDATGTDDTSWQLDRRVDIE
jgi:peptidoglycan-associated lipoprotein